MEALPNSRKLNGVSLVECLQQDVTDKDKKYNSIVKTPNTKRNTHYNNNTKRHPVSKSFRSLFKKLRGTTAVLDQQAGYANHNKSLPAPTKRIIVNTSCSSSSISSRSKPSYMKPKQHPSPIQENWSTTATSKNKNNNSSKNRHTLDFSGKWFEDESGATQNHVLKRTNSLCNDSSIYSTFTSTQQLTKEEPSLFTTSSSSLSSSLSSSYASSCIQQITDKISELKTSENKGVELFLTEEEKCYHELQQRLWHEDPTLCSKEEIATYLGQNSQARSRVLYLYMNNFDFANQRLDVAFRSLCAKLYLKAESQQLDRIVEAFAKRYYVCNPTTILHCFDVVYAVAYALLLLNTDLHLVSDWSHRMTKSSFVKNTMETVQSLIFPYLQRKRCVSLVSTDSSSYHVKRNDSSPSTVMSFEDTPITSSCNSSQISVHGNGVLLQKLDALRSNISWKSTNTQQVQQHHDGLTRMQKTWLVDIENLLKDIYASVKAQKIDQAEIVSVPDLPMPTTHSLQRSRTLPKNTTIEPSASARRRRRGQSVILTTPPPQEDTFTKQIKNDELFKQGLVMRKHIMESTDKRARHRQWQLCYLVMTDTELIMYRPVQPSTASSAETTAKQRRKSLHIWPPPTLHSSMGNAWQADFTEAPLATIMMNHTYASVIPPPGWSSQHPHVFRLHTAEGGLWLFESVDLFAIQAWVEACNTTAAKISKGSLQGAVSNVDYGWGAQWDNTSKLFKEVPVWHPPTPCMVKSTLDIEDQCLDIERQILQLNQQLNQHRELKWSVDKKFVESHQGCINSTQALTNWDKKLRYILIELIKLRCYKEILERY